MDYKEVKELTVHKRWGRAARYGDDYRSFSKQIDNFITHLVNGDSPLQWLPIDIMTEDEVSDLLLAYLDRKVKNRLLLKNLGYKGIRYDYTDFIVPDYGRQKEMEFVEEKFPELRDYQKIRLREVLPKINRLLVDASINGYIWTIKELLLFLDGIRINILDEKSLFKCMGLSLTNTGYIEEYIKICERMAVGTLFYFLVVNSNISDKREALWTFRQKLVESYHAIEGEIETAKKYMMRRKEYWKRFHAEKPYEASDISIYFVQFMERKAYYDELDRIAGLLEKENGWVSPGNQKDRKHPGVVLGKKQSMREYICEGAHVPDYIRKYEESKSIIGMAKDFGSFWVDERRPLDVKIAFREFFMSRQKYHGRTAMSMVRNILSSNVPTKQELMFLDAKVLRGYFREMGLTREYQVFNGLCSKIRHMFLKCYSAIDDVEAYRLIHRVCYEVLYLFGNSEYSGLVLE